MNNSNSHYKVDGRPTNDNYGMLCYSQQCVCVMNSHWRAFGSIMIVTTYCIPSAHVIVVVTIKYRRFRDLFS